MHPNKGDNGCWLFGTDSSAVTAEEKKLSGCLNPTFLSYLRLFFNPFWVFHVWMISSLAEQPRDGWKKGEKNPSFTTDDPWNDMKKK